ncbi:MFS transporter [Stenotrophomonas sp. BSUC-16]|uniref:MFS transporter n=1 Tax=Stenotrophomonas TaxID=40323 RepID=UPI000DA8A0A3|nr:MULTISPECIES: MFS transporter [Stenotrophomonas maltophilia group]MCZ7844175.1 MFS transporter [Stenotrophomonas maltophilia]MDJ1623804.1 MFS transporter [Stenotrophomonas sepilia]PZT36514.1 MFS transporter [Stenotrophomonas sepilia]
MSRRLLLLTIALLMFPQLAQTLYSPALADLGKRFALPPGTASQAMSLYLFGFAAGVLLWGRLADRIGRRPAILCGLGVFAVAALGGLLAGSFGPVLLAQALAAVGAAAASVVTQTVLRDHLQGPALAQAFSWIGMALALSPAIGLALGTLLVGRHGYAGVQAGLLLMVILLMLGCTSGLHESRPAEVAHTPMLPLLRQLLRDRWIWSQALLVTAFNVAMYSWYALGPFVFERLHWPLAWFGASGAVLALGSALGAWGNGRLLRAGVAAATRIRIAAGLVLTGGLLAALLHDHPALVAAMVPGVTGFGLAIPNVLGQALRGYPHCLGSAGALFGLLYYLLIGAAMALVGAVQLLAPTVIVCGLLALWLQRRRPAAT